MKIDDIDAFVAVVRCQSISQAAHELGLTQPAITRRVQSFEEALGAPLLDRNTKPPKPTELGWRVHEQCRAVLREVEALRTLASSAPEPAGALRLGLTQGLGELALPGALDGLRATWPGLALQVTTGWSGELIARIERGELAAAAVFVPQGRVPAKDLVEHSVLRTRLVVVARRGDWSAKSYRLAQCADAGWVLNPDGCGFRAALQRALAERGLPLRLRLDTHGKELQLQAVAQGAGLGLVPLPFFERSAWRKRLAIVPVSDFKPRIEVRLVHGVVPDRLRAPVDHFSASLARALGAA